MKDKFVSKTLTKTDVMMTSVVGLLSSTHKIANLYVNHMLESNCELDAVLLLKDRLEVALGQVDGILECLNKSNPPEKTGEVANA